MNTFKTSFFITAALMTERVMCWCCLEVKALPWVRSRAVEMVVETGEEKNSSYKLWQQGQSDKKFTERKKKLKCQNSSSLNRLRMR